MVFQQTLLKPISTSNIKRPSTPQVQIDNPLDKDIFVNGIELILGAEFSQKGKLIILINETPVFKENDSKAFFGYSKFPIPLGKVLRRSNDIQIFAWNGTDSNLIDVKVNLSLSAMLLPFNTQAETLTKEQFNTIVSEIEIIIAKADYSDQTLTGLLKLTGYKKILMIIQGAQNIATVVSSDFSSSANAVDADLNTKTGSLAPQVGVPIEIIVDFGSISARVLGFKYGWEGGTSSAQNTITVETSDDDISYTIKNTKVVGTGDTAAGTEQGTIASHSFRFAKIKVTHNAGTVRKHFVNELYDGDKLGGTASYSLEVKDTLGNWIQFVSAGTLGTVTSGAPLTKQLGDVSTDSGTNKFNLLLPSTQTDFRAKLVVSGNIQTGLTIIKVG